MAPSDNTCICGVCYPNIIAGAKLALTLDTAPNLPHSLYVRTTEFVKPSEGKKRRTRAQVPVRS